MRAQTVRVLAQSLDVELQDDEVCGEMVPDIEYRVRDVVQEAVKFMRHSRREQLTVADINSALRVRNAEVMFGYAVCDPPPATPIPGDTDMFVPPNDEKDLKEIQMAALPTTPAALRLSSHWLSIEGHQPSIPQNPSKASKGTGEASKSTSTSTTPTVTTSSGGKKVHPLSREQRVYLDRVVEAVKGHDQARFTRALDNVGADLGLSQLLPYFSEFIEQETKASMRNLPLLLRLLTFSQALLQNPNFDLEPYLHQLMPSILTCVVGKSLCATPQENHWLLRERGASLIVAICRRWNKKHQELQRRTIITLSKAYRDRSRALTTHYGAIVALAAFGHLTIHSVVLPHAVEFLSALDSLSQSSDTSAIRENEIHMCRGALLNAVAVYLRGVPYQDVPILWPYSQFVELFGESVVALMPPPNRKGMRRDPRLLHT